MDWSEERDRNEKLECRPAGFGSRHVRRFDSEAFGALLEDCLDMIMINISRVRRGLETGLDLPFYRSPSSARIRYTLLGQ